MLVVAAVVVASRGGTRSRYRRRRVTRADATMVDVAWIAPAILGGLTLAGDRSLAWSAEPLTWPQVGVLPLLALVPLLAPMARRPWDDAVEIADLMTVAP